MTAAPPPQAAEAAQAPSGGPLSHQQVLVVLSGLLVGMFLAALDQTVVSTAMRTIADELQGQTSQAWVTTSYLITSTVSTPLYGKLSDSYGRKPFYLGAITVFVVGSLLCGTATDVHQLAAYRAVQGLGAGGLLSLAFMIVGDLVPPRERGRYQGWFMAVFGVSSVLGPVVGGALAGQETLLGADGWRWIFWLNAPLGLLALVAVSRRLHLPPRPPHEGRVDWAGAVLLVSTAVPLLLLAEQGREWGWTSPLALGLLAGSVLSLVLFVRVERSLGESAVLPLRVFRIPVFRVTAVISLLVGVGMFGSLVVVPLHLQVVRGHSPTEAGLLMVPLMVGILTTSAVAARYMSRTGRYKALPVAGTSLVLVGVLVLSTAHLDTPLWRVLAGTAVVGLGLGLTMQTLVVSVQNALPLRDIGIATGSQSFFRSLGGTLGAAASLGVLFGTLTARIQDRAVAAGLPQEVVDRFARTSALDDTSVLESLPAPVRRVVLQGFADAMGDALLLVGLALVPALVLAVLVPELPLRGTAGPERRPESEAPAGPAPGAGPGAVAGETAKADSAVV